MIDIRSGEIITRVDKRGIRIKKKKSKLFNDDARIGRGRKK